MAGGSGSVPESSSFESGGDSRENAGNRSGEQALHAQFSSVLQQILAAADQGKVSANDPAWAELLQVAARYPHADFCVDPILSDMIHVVTRRFQGISENRRTAMRKAVAETLADDQTSLVRLQHLWAEIQRIVANA